MAVALRTCPLCEATCGLELTIEGDRITHARGDQDHVFSRGYICPKGAAFGELVHDPDRLRRPLIRSGSSRREVSWEEAFAEVDRGLRTVIDRGGNDAVGVYAGNPSVHTLAGGLYLAPLLQAMRTKNTFTAASVDQMPKHVACGYMFGHPLSIPVPDLDRTDHMLILGANPWESNGSLATAPDFRGRLKALQKRGGRFIVVDPRRTRTAAQADEHVPIIPGTDALLLFAIVNTLFEEELVKLGRLADLLDGVDALRRLALDFPAERVAAACGIPAERIRLMARDLHAAPTAVVYGRVGTSTVEFGTLTSWLVDAVNILTGNLDSPGGAMFPLAPHRNRGTGRGGGFVTGRWTGRASGRREILGQLPAATIADEIEAGGVRAFITVAGNPVVSTPNSGRLDRALSGLEFMVSVDPYLNETSRHASVILPPTDPARVGHYDFAFADLAVRNIATYSPPVLPPNPGDLDESTILGRLTLIATGAGPAGDLSVAQEALMAHLLSHATGRPGSNVAGRDVSELRSMVSGETPAEMLVDIRVRTGAYGDGFGANPDGLSLEKLRANPHGIDLGPLEPRLPEILRTPSGRVEICPPEFAADVPRLLERLGRPPGTLVLVGRRHLRSNNSWMHNVPSLMTGGERCTLQVNPLDAEAMELVDGGQARVSSRAGELMATVEVTDDLMRGVVCLPHGFGHDPANAHMRVAGRHPGVNSNILSDELVMDPLSGNAVLNGIPVLVECVPLPVPA